MLVSHTGAGHKLLDHLPRPSQHISRELDWKPSSRDSSRYSKYRMPVSWQLNLRCTIVPKDQACYPPSLLALRGHTGCARLSPEEGPV